MEHLLKIFLCLIFSLNLYSETIYVSQNSSGSDDGSSEANSKSVSWLNNTSNWGTGVNKISPGDTVILNGTITNTISVGGDGSEGNPITLLFATNAKMIKGSWSDPQGAIYLSSHDWITIDGGLNGIIQATNNGTTKTFQEDASGIRGDGVTGITIQNLTITNLYERTPQSNDGNRYGYAIALQDVRNLLIQTNKLWGGDTMVAATWTTGISSNWTIRGNTIGGCNHGITLGTAQAGSYLKDIIVEGNHIDNLYIWDGNTGLHLDGIIFFVESPAPGYDGWVSNAVFNGNIIGPKIGITNTAAIFIDTYRHWQVQNSKFVNNVFTVESPYAWTGGFINVGACTNTLVANNTMVSYSQTGIGISGGGSMQLTNNLFYGVGTPISLGPAPAIPVGFASDRNLFWNFYSDGSGGFYHPNYAAGNLTTWRGLGFDLNSSTNQPSLDSSYVPLGNDVNAKNVGVNLSAYFSVDANQHLRSGLWDIGAYEYQGTQWYVDKNASGLANGTTIDNAWPSISSISWASILSEDILWISPGNYNETLSVDTKNNITIQIYTNNPGIVFLNKIDLWKLNESTINGLRGSSPSIWITNDFFVAQLCTNSIIRGIKVDRSTTYSNDVDQIHGFYVWNACSQITLADCISQWVTGDGYNINQLSLDGDPYSSVILTNCMALSVGDDGIQLAQGNAHVTKFYGDTRGFGPFFGGHPDGVQLNPDNGNLIIEGSFFKGFQQFTFIERAKSNIFVLNNIMISGSTNGTDVGVSYSTTNFIGTFLIANNTFVNFLSYGAIGGDGVSTNGQIIANNIFYNCKKGSINVLQTNLMNSNNIWWDSPSVQYYDSSGNPVSPPDSRNFGASIVSASNILFTGEPGSTNVSNYSLQRYSPARNIGSDLSQYFSKDYTGTNRNIPWDSGAFEYTFSSPIFDIQSLKIRQLKY